MADLYCRACRATFDRPLPRPYGAICPDCLGRGDVISLTEPPATNGAEGRQQPRSRHATPVPGTRLRARDASRARSPGTEDQGR